MLLEKRSAGMLLEKTLGAGMLLEKTLGAGMLLEKAQTPSWSWRVG